MNDMKLIMENWRSYEKVVLSEQQPPPQNSCEGSACLTVYTVGEFLNDVQRHTGLAQKAIKTVKNVLTQNQNDPALVKGAKGLLNYLGDKGLGYGLGALVGGALGSVVPGAGTAVGASGGATVGALLGEPISDLIKLSLASLNKGMENMLSKAQVPDGSPKTPMQKIMDMNDTLEALIKGGDQSSNSELHRQFMNQMTKEFTRIEDEIKTDMASAQGNSTAMTTLMAKPLKDYMRYTLDQSTLNFINQEYSPTKGIEVSHPEIT